MNGNLCDICIHNRSATSLDCELGCTGVAKIEDDGLIVTACDDFAGKGGAQCFE